jgi:hypothetical protein
MGANRATSSPTFDDRAAPKIAIIWRGEPSLATPVHNDRLAPVAQALTDLGIDVPAIIWSEALADEVRSKLLTCDGALVWVDPLTDGQDRTLLDAVLSEVSRQGVWVSAHPDVVLKMGVKEVLVRTKELGWGSDVHAYETVAEFQRQFPTRLATDGVRVLKQNRGNSNQGVWKVMVQTAVEPVGPESLIDAVEARSDEVERGLRLGDFMERCAAYLSGAGRLIDQAFHPRVGEGLVRCYMSRGRVIGFSEQFPRSRSLADPAAPTFGMAREKTMHPADAPAFQRLRAQMEGEWTPGLQRLLDIDLEALPVLWDADFLRGPESADGTDSFVLCEINVSCVVPFPPTAPAAVASAARDAVLRRQPAVGGC